MVGRVRERTRQTTSSGTAVRSYLNQVFYSGFSPTDSDHEYCSDNTTPRPHKYPTSWSKYRKKSVGGVLTGTCPYSYTTGGTVTFNSCRTINRTNYAYCPDITPINFGYWVTLALGNLNPRRPHTDLPLFLFELREFPGMLRDLGRVLQGRISPGDVPGGHLAYEFGWRPLFSDLNSLLGLRRAIKARARYLSALEGGKSIFRRRLTSNRLIQDTVSPTPYTAYNVGPSTNPWALRAKVKTTEYLDVWFTARAKLRDPIPSFVDLPNRALRHAYGLTPRPDLVWNAIPWSWLTDWYTNFGDMLEATDALQHLRVQDMCIMAHSTVESRLIDVEVKSGLSYTESVLYTEYKQRSVSTSPTSHLVATPFLNGRQQSILGSLVTSRALRAARL